MTRELTLPFANRRFMQICWVVTDLEEAIDHWHRQAGVGPFFQFDQVVFEQGCYRGQPSPFADVCAAIAQAGDLQIELVCQRDDRPSIFRELVPVGSNGLHHMALYCEDYDRDLNAYRQSGAEIAFSGLMMDARTCWIDTTSSLGFMVELIEANPVADAVFKTFRDAAKDWNGSDRIRHLG